MIEWKIENPSNRTVFYFYGASLPIPQPKEWGESPVIVSKDITIEVEQQATDKAALIAAVKAAKDMSDISSVIPVVKAISEYLLGK